jgi:hypothetical protein
MRCKAGIDSIQGGRSFAADHSTFISHATFMRLRHLFIDLTSNAPGPIARLCEVPN